jgi:Kef-type K+ transport system membrane component KefB
LAFSAGLVFLLPMFFVIFGAYLSGELWAQSSLASLGRWQTVGALAGLVAGVLFAKLILMLMGSRRLGEGSMSDDD